MRFLLLLATAFFLSAASAVTAAHTVDLGYARYAPNPHPAIDNFTIYNGIRYAAAPRFGPPTVPAMDRRVQVARDNGTACPQILPDRVIAGVSRQSEDCLLLDVYIPEGASLTDQLPVLVHIHGGGYTYLSKNAFYPTQLAQHSHKSFVFVSISYRLGAYGFLAGKDYTKHGGLLNAGLHDQQMALKWVQSHITKFGGDPNQVAIFGQSAGAGSVLQQSIASGNEGLFQRVLAASPYLPPQPRPDSPLMDKYYRLLAEKVGCTGEDHHSSFHCIRQANESVLTKAQTDLQTDLAYTGLPPYGPCIDGELISDDPIKLLEEKRVPRHTTSLVGSNVNEGAIFLPAPNITTPAQVRLNAKAIWQGFDNGTIDELLALYPSQSNHSSEPASRMSYTTEAGRLARMYADAIFVCPANLFAGAFDSSQRYEFAVSPSLHALDVDYYFPEQTIFSDYHFPTLKAVQSTFVTRLATFLVSGKPLAHPAYDAQGHHFMPSYDSRKQTEIRQLNFTNDILPAEYAAEGVQVTRVSTQRSSGTGKRGDDLCSFWSRNFPRYWPQ